MVSPVIVIYTTSTAKITERELTKLYHMFEVSHILKMHVKNLGFPPFNLWAHEIAF